MGQMPDGLRGDNDVKNRFRVAVCCVGLLVAATVAQAQTGPRKPAVRLAFTVSMEQPATHIYHVVFRCEGLGGPTRDFKMPVW